MLGSTEAFPGAGWNITLVFLVLMVSPKIVQASEKRSILCCISVSELASRAQLSANRKSQMKPVLTLESDVKSYITIPESISQHGRKHQAEQGWCKHAPLVMGKGSDVPPLYCTLMYHHCTAPLYLPHYLNELAWAARLNHDFPQSFPASFPGYICIIYILDILQL